MKNNLYSKIKISLGGANIIIGTLSIVLLLIIFAN